MKKIKIIQITHAFEVGGIETLVLELCNKLDKEKYEVHLLTLTNNKLNLVQSLNKDIIVHHLHLNEKQLKSFKGLMSGLKELIKLLELIKPVIVHTHLSTTNLFLTSLAIRLSKIKILYFKTIHTTDFHYENQKTIINKMRLLIEKMAMKITKTFLISISNTVHKNNNFYFKKIVEDIKLIPNGIDLEKYNKKKYNNISKIDFDFSTECILITYVARLHNGKNHELLIDIWNDIIKQVPNAKLCFAGDGMLKDYLIQKVKINNSNESIKFLGSIQNVPALLSVTDIGVFPSSFEGFGLVMLEKFAMKLPVVASDIEPFKEMAKDMESAFLVSLDDKRKFVDSIVTLCNDASLRRQIGEHAYNIAEKFSIENTVTLHDKYYTKHFKTDSKE